MYVDFTSILFIEYYQLRMNLQRYPSIPTFLCPTYINPHPLTAGFVSSSGWVKLIVVVGG